MLLIFPFILNNLCLINRKGFMLFNRCLHHSSLSVSVIQRVIIYNFLNNISRMNWLSRGRWGIHIWPIALLTCNFGNIHKYDRIRANFIKNHVIGMFDYFADLYYYAQEDFTWQEIWQAFPELFSANVSLWNDFHLTFSRAEFWSFHIKCKSLQKHLMKK